MKIKARYGAMDVIESDPVISRSLTMYGEWAEKEIDLLRNFISPGDFVFDVGAYIGTHSLAFKSMVGLSGKVFSFEPQPEVFKILQSNVSDSPQMFVHNIGLGSEKKILSKKFEDIGSGQNLGGTSLKNLNHVDGANSSIEISTIDIFNPENLDLIKIDVEGMEEQVLTGASKSISKHTPHIYLECNNLKSTNFIFEFCSQFGYEAYGFVFKAFNETNFFKNLYNFFEDASEAGILLISSEKKSIYEHVLEKYKLAPLIDEDDLVSMLLHIPQYHTEVLDLTATSKILGTEYVTPYQRKVTHQLQHLHSEIFQLQETNEAIRRSNNEMQLEILRINNSRLWKMLKPVRTIYKTISQFFNLK